jgi:hypothetical protein
VSYDALMRWEWEGGTPAFASGRDEAARAEPAETTLTGPQPSKTRRRPRPAAAVSPRPVEGWQGNGSEH